MPEVIIILLIVAGLILVMPIVAIVKASGARRQAEELNARLTKLAANHVERIALLEEQVRKLKARSLDHAEQPPVQPVEVAASKPAEHATPPQVIEQEPEVAKPVPVPPVVPLAPIELPTAEPVHTPPPLPVPPKERPPTIDPVALETSRPVRPPQPPRPQLNMEQFVGVKLFAWAAGLALFLGIIFAVKYSFEHNLIPPSVRVAFGFLTGIGLVGGGLWVQRHRAYEVLAHTLSAAGVLVLYGVTFAAQSLYHFFPPAVTFGLMALITAAGFVIAVRLNAQVVAVLGMVGGFLTPILCSTGQDNPVGLFVYIALLDCGLIAVAKHRRWLHLTTLGAIGTALMQLGWLMKFFDAGHYFEGSKTAGAMSIFFAFAALFAAATWWSKRREDEDAHPAFSALGMCATAMFVAFGMLDYGSITERPVLFYGFVMLINAAALFTAWVEPRVRFAPGLIGAATFIHLSLWTMGRLTDAMLPLALGIYLVFGLIHTGFGLLWQRKYPHLPATAAPWMPVITLVLMMMPLFGLKHVSFLLWPAMLLVNLAIVGLALMTRRLLPVLFGIVLTLLGAFFWLVLPVHRDAFALPLFLCVVGGFAIVFIVASLFLGKRVSALDNHAGFNLNDALPICSAVMPFALLIMAVLQLQISNPAPVFGLALLLTGFLLAMTKMTRAHGLGLAALACVLALEYAWNGASFQADQPLQPLLWSLGFYAVFAIFPFAFRKHFEQSTVPWITSAIAGLGTFGLVYRMTKLAWPVAPMGLIAAAFAVPALLSLIVVVKQHRENTPARLSQLAWFGGVALFFITLVFPLEFDRQWLTIAWALEGAALLWLFQRVPHQGLRYVATGLLTVAFIRLGLNPSVFDYHQRGSTPILNWFLYSYGLVAAAQFASIKLLREPHHKLGEVDLRGVFGAFGGVLLFILLNIEIADYFTAPGAHFITFEFSGNLARDMCYSIAWGLFALALLITGFMLRSKGTRYAGIGLMGITLVKLFFHDLASIDSIYRIGALIAVAIIALAASFLYQRFLDRDSKS